MNNDKLTQYGVLLVLTISSIYADIFRIIRFSLEILLIAKIVFTFVNIDFISLKLFGFKEILLVYVAVYLIHIFLIGRVEASVNKLNSIALNSNHSHKQ